jgi:hypothetical protein
MVTFIASSQSYAHAGARRIFAHAAAPPDRSVVSATRARLIARVVNFAKASTDAQGRQACDPKDSAMARLCVAQAPAP